MQQLSGMDASFLYGETPERPHGRRGPVDLRPVDRARRPGHVQGHPRVHRGAPDAAKTFRRRLVRVPFDLDHPYWIEDPDFDLEFHVRHIALPKPGDWRQLCIQAARLIARPLDLNRPLWEFYVDRGPRQGRGRAAGQLRHRLEDPPRRHRRHGRHGDDERRPRARAGPAAAGSRTSDVAARARALGDRLLAQAAINNTLKPMHFARVMGRSIPTVGRVQRQLRRSPAARRCCPCRGPAGAAPSAPTGSSTAAASRCRTCAA